MNIKRTIGDVVDLIKNEKEVSNHLLSLTIHGSGLEAKATDTYIDYDIIFIYENVDFCKKITSIENTFKAVCATLSNNDTQCFFAIKSGPMHPLRKDSESPLFDINEKRIVFFHISVFSENDYCGKNSTTAPSPLLVYRWQNFSPIIGIPLKSIRSVPNISIDDIINAGLGIDNCINMLKNKQKGYWYWKQGKMTWTLEKFSDFDDYEIAIYALKWCIKNSIAYLSDILPLNRQCNDKLLFENHFVSKDSISIYKTALDFKANIMHHRNEYVMSPNNFRMIHDIEQLTNGVIKILLDVKERLLLIQKLNTLELLVPNSSGDIPIYFSFDLKLMLQKAIAQHGYDKIMIISDSNIGEHYDLKPWIVESGVPFCEYVITDGISDKSPEKLLKILKFAENSTLTTSSLLILFGGGSVGNLGGMVAGLIFRGIKFIHIPTTVLAQLDSSIGCKQSVNGFISKNKFGLFHSPESININPLLNTTLDDIQVKSGIIEGLKHGFCQSDDLLNMVTKYDYQKKNILALCDVIINTIECKLEYMQVDPYENSPEQHLELGHKLAHALEFSSNETIPHGICVAFGMVAEAYFLCQRGVLSEKVKNQIITETKKVVEFINLPKQLSTEEITQCVLLDNKRNVNTIPFVVLLDVMKPKSIKITINETFTKELKEAVDFARCVFYEQK